MKEEFMHTPMSKEVNLLKRNHPMKRMIKMNIAFNEEYNSRLVSWVPYSHVETHFLVHALNFILAMFKVAVNKEGLHLSPQGCRD